MNDKTHRSDRLVYFLGEAQDRQTDAAFGHSNLQIVLQVSSWFIARPESGSDEHCLENRNRKTLNTSSAHRQFTRDKSRDIAFWPELGMHPESLYLFKPGLGLLLPALSPGS